MTTGGWRGPGWRVVDAHPRHAKQIRDWISAAITAHDCPVDPADAALAVSELFANAVMHGPAQGRVLTGYCLWAHGARIVVCDGGDSAMPELRQVTGQAEGGRGLHVIDSVTARWGSFHLAGNLVTWCDLGQPVNSPASDAWAWLHTALSASGPLFVPAAQSAGPAPGPADIRLLIPVSAAGPSMTASPAATQPSARTASPSVTAPDALPCERACLSRFPCFPGAPAAPLLVASPTRGDGGA